MVTLCNSKELLLGNLAWRPRYPAKIRWTLSLGINKDLCRIGSYLLIWCRCEWTNLARTFFCLFWLFWLERSAWKVLYKIQTVSSKNSLRKLLYNSFQNRFEKSCKNWFEFFYVITFEIVCANSYKILTEIRLKIL